MLNHGSRLFKLETTLAGLSGVLGAVTLFWRDWIEVTGWNPDQHGGSAERVIAAALIVMALVLGALARREYRRRLPAVA